MKYFYLFIIFLALQACNEENKQDTDKRIEVKETGILDSIPKFKIDTIIDKRDGKKYSTIQINHQVWTSGIIEYQSKKGKMYRQNLYNWTAAEEAIIKPYRIPSQDDWDELFKYLYDSLIMKLSPRLIEKLNNEFNSLNYKNYLSNNWQSRLPSQFKIDSVIYGFKNIDYENAKMDRDFQPLIFCFLEQVGFETRGSGFRYNRGLGVDDYSYFWTSDKDNSNDHLYMRIYTGNFCQGCGYYFNMAYNDSYAFNLKLVKNE